MSNFNFPKIVHLIYFPWDKKTGKLKLNEYDFDYTFYNKFVDNNNDWEIKLWTLSKIKNFTNEFYPQYVEVWKKIKHPTQCVDFFRALVTYHFGGIYWQYDSKQMTNLNNFIPENGNLLKLFVECIITQEFANKMKKERIRNNKPEELVRISYGCFSAYPKNIFLKYCIEKSWNNLHNYEVKTQYDILYVGANAMFSEAYHEYINKDKIELCDNTDEYISFLSRGSWRLKSY